MRVFVVTGEEAEGLEVAGDMSEEELRDLARAMGASQWLGAQRTPATRRWPSNRS
jgi:hypothetical protein